MKKLFQARRVGSDEESYGLFDLWPIYRDEKGVAM